MIEFKSQIAFLQAGLAGILKQYRLVVPPNQREYAWTENEVTTLLRDLAKAISDGEGVYFLGTIVTIPRSPEQFEVVDGQQRLATTAILLSEIRDFLRDSEPLISESIENSFLTEIDRAKRDRVAKLDLNLDDNEFFHQMIAGTRGAEPEPSRESHKRIRDSFHQCRAHIRKIVSGFDPKDYGDILNKWIYFLEHGAQVILLKVPSDVNAYKMFETLNDRGLKTSQSDLVKNYLFGQSGDKRLNEAQQKWALMRGALETLEEEDITVTFLRHSLIAIRGHLREVEVYEGVQSLARGAPASITFLTDLESLAQNYVAIFNPEHEFWNGYPDAVRRAIQTLNFVNIRPLRPLMLAVASRFSGPETALTFDKLIAWGVRLLVAASTRSASVEIPISAAAHSVFQREIPDARALHRRLAAIIPNDEQFQQAFQVMTVSKASLARYYLRSLEQHANGQASPWFMPNADRETINLEHVLPVNRDEQWAHFTDESARTYVRRLGNMCLLIARNNADLRSADFNTKKEAYRESPYVLTRSIADEREWTEDRIATRQRHLAELAARTWPV